jgi:hypothetical protein
VRRRLRNDRKRDARKEEAALRQITQDKPGVTLRQIPQGRSPALHNLEGAAAEWFERFDPITADFTYVRWLGDRMQVLTTGPARQIIHP